MTNPTHEDPKPCPSEVELKPCPFCGSDDVGMSYSTSMESAEPLNHMVECGACSALGPSCATVVVGGSAAQQNAIAAWNTRQAADALEAATPTPDDVGKIVAHLIEREQDFDPVSEEAQGYSAGWLAAAAEIQRGDWRDTPSAARDELTAEAQEMGLYPSPSDQGWRDIESAPVNTPVRVTAGSMTFLARLIPNASMSSEETSCDQWQAEIEGEHPPCWSGGCCWESNEDEALSLQPTHWRSTEPSGLPGDGRVG